jgi:ferrous iron transport protein A
MRALAVGERARVKGYRACDEAYRRRLLDMGLVKGAEFVLIRRAPLGDPVEIEVRGYRLSLRQDEAACLCVEPCGGAEPPDGGASSA